MPGNRASSPGYVAYITRPDALTGGRNDWRAFGFPAAVTGRTLPTFPSERIAWIAWASVRERAERATARERGARNGRTHYRAVLSVKGLFTPDAVGTVSGPADSQHVLDLATRWVRTCFPRACALLALHRNTAHPHIHLWLDARQCDGRKINLSARAFRQLDEVWIRLYCRDRGWDEQIFLRRKWEREYHRQYGRAFPDQGIRVRERRYTDRSNRERRNHEAETAVQNRVFTTPLAPGAGRLAAQRAPGHSGRERRRPGIVPATVPDALSASPDRPGAALDTRWDFAATPGIPDLTGHGIALEPSAPEPARPIPRASGECRPLETVRHGENREDALRDRDR